MKQYTASNGSVWDIDDGGHFLSACEEGYGGPPEPCFTEHYLHSKEPGLLKACKATALCGLEAQIEEHIQDQQWTAAEKAREALDDSVGLIKSRGANPKMQARALATLDAAFGPRLKGGA